MPQICLQCFQIITCHQRIDGEGMAKIVEAHIRQSFLPEILLAETA